MERVVNQDERIRRAEELYARRKMQIENIKSTTVNVDTSKTNKITRKLIIQFIICLIIYCTYYMIKNIPDLVTQDIMYKISDILEYDINVQELYKKFNDYIKKNEETIQTNEYNNLIEDTLSASDTTIDSEDKQDEYDSSEIEEIVENQIVEESSSISQMQVDAEYIKQNCSIIKPLEGEITSRYGIRNPTVQTVPKYHTGIDIARTIGTVIVSAMEGTVELVSSQGDLRKSRKNNKWRSVNSICSL